MKPRGDPYTDKAEPGDDFIMTDCVRAGTQLIEAVLEFRLAYRAAGNDNDNIYDCLLDIIHGTWGEI